MFDNKIHENYIQEDFEFPTNKIAQVDGNDSVDDDDDEFVFDDNDSIAHLGPGPGPVSISTMEPITTDQRTATFALNRNKQIQTIAVDATRPDFEIEINDSDRNINVHCSSGFYDAVAKPVICGFSKGTTLNINNISVNCKHVDHNRDSRCYEYNRVLHIDISGDGQLKIGKVTIHLHHTRRLVQLQGSAKMPDGNRAPVWFLTNFIKDRFTHTARQKHYDIAALNDTIIKAVGRNPTSGAGEKSCSLCSRLFTSNAKPTQCSSCSNYFHKTKCIPAHTLTCSPPSSSLTSKPAPGFLAILMLSS